MRAGNQPAVVARGGFSGLFPESSDYATQMAIQTSISDVIILCNLQLTKDSVGICLSDIRLDNSTNIDQVYANQSKTYNVNGQDVTGWFPVDYTTEQLLSNVSCKFKGLNFIIMMLSFANIKKRDHLLQ